MRWAIVIGGAAALAAAVWYVRQPPSWYAPPRPDDIHAAALAELLEHRLAEEVHEVRDEAEPWTIRLREHQVNAWLATRLPRWIAREVDLDWPAGLGTIQVRFRVDSIEVAIPINHNGRQRLFVAEAVPELLDDELLFRLVRLSAGRIPLPGNPASHLRKHLEGYQPEHADGLLVFETRDGSDDAYCRVIPILELADRRLVRLVDLHLGLGFLDLTAVTDRTTPSQRPEDLLLNPPHPKPPD